MIAARACSAKSPCLQYRVALFALLWIVLATGRPALSQGYPPGPQISKDGTAVLVQDYASLPLSTARKEGALYPPRVDYSVQLGPPTSFHSEPASAPLAKKRFFVVDQNGVLYILDNATRKVTPYTDLGSIYPRFIAEPPFGRASCRWHSIRTMLGAGSFIPFTPRR
jgi:hypothetical protein